jgi:hypothetical protein
VKVNENEAHSRASCREVPEMTFAQGIAGKLREIALHGHTLCALLLLGL